MKIQLFSDIHQEFPNHNWREYVTPKAPIAVVPGDIDARNLVKTINDIATEFEHVITLAGNHDFYGKDINWITPEVKEQFAPNVSFLDRDVVVLEDISFIGCTLWSDVKNEDWFVKQSLKEAISDFFVIKDGIGRFGVGGMISRSLKEQAWLRLMLDQVQGKKVIVTHFMPSVNLCHPRHGRTLLDHYFAASCEDILESGKADAWLFGHTHDRIETEICGMKVRCNPLGYPGEFAFKHEDMVVEL